MVVGLALLILATFLLGLAGGLTRPFYSLLYGAFVAWGGWVAWQHRGTWKPAAGWWWGRKPGLTDRVLGGFVLAIIGLEYFVAQSPELFFDSLVYHLGVTSQWIQHARIVALPTVFFSNLPMNVEMLYTGALLLADETLCRVLHVSLGVLAVLAVFAMGRRWFGRRVGFWASGIMATIPLVFLNASVSGVDVGAGFFTAVALLVLLNTFLAETLRSRDIWLSGLLVGVALGCKYNMAFMLAPAIASLLAYRLYRRESARVLLPVVLKLAAGTLICLMPWMAKNIAFTGNPVYPFLFKVIPSRYIHLDKMQQQMDGFKEYGQRTWVQFLKVPWDLSFYYPSANSYLGVVFLFLLPGFLWLGLVARRAPPVQNILWGTAVATTLIWAVETQIARYLLPGFCVLAVLSAYVLERAERWFVWFGRTMRWCVLGLIFWGLGNVSIIALLNWDPIGVGVGLQNREAYLEQHLMMGYYPMARVINRLPGKVKVYIFGETRSYYIEKEVTAVTVYDANRLLEWVAAGPTAEAVWQQLRQAGYTHLYIHAPEAARTRGYEKYCWTPDAVARWQELTARYLKRVSLIGQQSLYEVLAAPDMKRPIKPGRALFMYNPEVVANVGSHADQTMALAQQGRYLDYEVAWQRIMQLTPEWDVPYTMLGWMYQKQKRMDDALAMYRRAEQLTELSPELYHELGIMLWNTRQPLEAIHCLRRALDEAPTMDAVRKNLETMEASLREGKNP